MIIIFRVLVKEEYSGISNKAECLRKKITVATSGAIKWINRLFKAKKQLANRQLLNQ